MVGGLLGSYDDPRKAGLLAAAASLLQSSGPSLTPTTLSQGIGNALMGGQRQALNAGLARQRSRELDQREAVRGLEQQKFQAGIDSQRERNKMIMDFASTLPPQLRTRFLLNPEEFLKPKVVAPGGSLADQSGALYSNPNKPPAPSALTQLMQERDALPPGDPRRATYDEAIKKQSSHQPQIVNNVGPQGVDYGTAPSGMVWARKPDGSIALENDPSGFMRPRAVPIAGGPVETKAAEAERAKAEGQRQKAVYADVVSKDVQRAIDLVETGAIPVTGPWAITSAVPGTKAHDVSKLVDTIKANVGFDRLQQMRASSPTGGALGQVSEMENKLLQATIGNLEQSQSKDQFIYNLKRVQDLYLDIIHGPGNRPSDKKDAPKVNPKLQDLLDKYAPNG